MSFHRFFQLEYLSSTTPLSCSSVIALYAMKVQISIIKVLITLAIRLQIRFLPPKSTVKLLHKLRAVRRRLHVRSELQFP